MRSLSSGAIAAIFTSLFGAAVALSVSFEAKAHGDGHEAEVLTLGAAATEIVFALEEGHRVVARDSTSTWPPEARDLPDVGYFRAISPEGVLSMGPSMILSTEGAGPPEAVDVLKGTGIQFVTLPEGFTGEAIAEKIRRVGDALGVPEKAEALSAQVKQDLAEAQSYPKPDTRKRVLFLMSASGGKLIAAGRNTAADAVIRLAGGENALSGFDGYKPVSDESVSVAAPDAVLMMDRGGDHSATSEQLFALPALVTSPAAENSALIKMNGIKLLGFGPRTAEAVRELNAVLYGQ